MKRAASPKAHSPKPKKSKADPVKIKANSVVDALNDGNFEVPGHFNVREMLVAAAPNVLRTLQDERHSYQETIFRMLAEVFQAEEARRQGVVAEVKGRVDAAESELSVRQAAKGSAEANVQAKNEEIAAKKEVLATDAAAVRAEETVQREALEHKSAAAAENQVHLNEKEKSLKVQNVDLEALKAGSWDGTRAQRAHLSVVTPFFKKLSADASMITAMQSALGKKPDERGVFDNMVVTQVEETLAKHFVSLEGLLANTEAVVAEKTATANTAEQSHSACQEKQSASAAAVTAAQGEKKELEGVLKAQAKTVNEQQKIVDKLTNELNTVEASHQEAAEVNATVTFLRERVIVPEPEPVVEEEPAAEEAAPQE